MGEGISQMEKGTLSRRRRRRRWTPLPGEAGTEGGSVSFPGVLASSGGRCWEAERKGLQVPQGQTSLI